MTKAASMVLVTMPLVVVLGGCRRDMFDQPKYRPLAPSQFFTDGRSARQVPAGTFRFDETEEDATVERGTTANGTFVASIPIPVDEALLRRGLDRFNIYCTPCHGQLGDGHGMVAQRGFLQPSNLHSERVRNAPPGYIYGVISNGYGAMPVYGDQLSVHDRWAVVAYIRALELSRHATPAEVPAEQRTALEKMR